MIEGHPPHSHLIDLGVAWAITSLKVPPSNSTVEPILRTTDPKKVGKKMEGMTNRFKSP